MVPRSIERPRVRLDEGAALVEHHVPAAALVGVLAQEIDQQRLREIAVVEAGFACQPQDRATRGIVNLAGVGGQREVGAGLQVGGRQHAVGGILDGDALGLLGRFEGVPAPRRGVGRAEFRPALLFPCGSDLADIAAHALGELVAVAECDRGLPGVGEGEASGDEMHGDRHGLVVARELLG